MITYAETRNTRDEPQEFRTGHYALDFGGVCFLSKTETQPAATHTTQRTHVAPSPPQGRASSIETPRKRRETEREKKENRKRTKGGQQKNGGEEEPQTKTTIGTPRTEHKETTTTTSALPQTHSHTKRETGKQTRDEDGGR